MSEETLARCQQETDDAIVEAPDKASGNFVSATIDVFVGDPTQGGQP
jgi:hypothetical protein